MPLFEKSIIFPVSNISFSKSMHSRLALIIRNEDLSIIDMDKSKFNPQSYGPDADVAIFDLRVHTETCRHQGISITFYLFVSILGDDR